MAAQGSLPRPRRTELFDFLVRCERNMSRHNSGYGLSVAAWRLVRELSFFVSPETQDDIGRPGAFHPYQFIISTTWVDYLTYRQRREGLNAAERAIARVMRLTYRNPPNPDYTDDEAGF